MSSNEEAKIEKDDRQREIRKEILEQRNKQARWDERRKRDKWDRDRPKQEERVVDRINKDSRNYAKIIPPGLPRERLEYLYTKIRYVAIIDSLTWHSILLMELMDIQHRILLIQLRPTRRNTLFPVSRLSLSTAGRSVGVL